MFVREGGGSTKLQRTQISSLYMTSWLFCSLTCVLDGECPVLFISAVLVSIFQFSIWALGAVPLEVLHLVEVSLYLAPQHSILPHFQLIILSHHCNRSSKQFLVNASSVFLYLAPKHSILSNFQLDTTVTKSRKQILDSSCILHPSPTAFFSCSGVATGAAVHTTAVQAISHRYCVRLGNYSV